MTTYIYGCREITEDCQQFVPFEGQKYAVMLLDDHLDMDIPFLKRKKAGELNRRLRAGDRVMMFPQEVEEFGEIQIVVDWENRGVEVDYLRLALTWMPPVPSASTSIANNN